MKKLALALLLVGLVAVALWVALPSGAREVTFVTAQSQALVTTVQTNGKAEPFEWQAVRAGRDGAVASVAVELGQQVAEGDLILEFDQSTAQAGLAAAQARIEQAQSLIALYDSGGSPAEVTEADRALSNARLELETAQKEAASLERLVEQQAATRHELALAEERVQRAEVEVAALEKRRSELVLPSQRQEAEAALRSAQADAAQSQRLLNESTVRAPTGGAVYALPVRKGSFVQPGELLAEVGRLDRLRITIYVDEPELNSVHSGMPVIVTWDALPDREWDGVVEKLPTQIVPLGTRQVGEVLAVIDNPDLELPASANINAQLRSEVSSNAITIPKAALHRQGDRTGVWKLDGDTVSWQEVQLGAANITDVEVLSGISAGDRVALPADPPLAEGEQVTPVIQ